MEGRSALRRSDQVTTAAEFCHIVIPAPDLEKAKAFYESVFGWSVRPGTPGPAYWFFESGNVGGAFDGNATPARGVVLVLRVPDVDAAVDAIERSGGTVTRGRDPIERGGSDAYFTDPNGNEFGVYSD